MHVPLQPPEHEELQPVQLLLQPDTQFAEQVDPQPPVADPVQPPEQLEQLKEHVPPQS
ncbi:hypothetical protein LPQ46_004523 [Salmonella enterica]|nr:hypothetical protein [Salmonella enterica]EIN7676950.1 hypothetical protein [Salmonella enterica]EJT5726369.1 hypothetical protein [Escherichia coli]MCV8334825.1 hypothetical protein [Escherichia coli]HDH8613085.1 hypothetical protein [Escherichia coli]